MPERGWIPWRNQVELRDELKKPNELALEQFAADLYDLVLQRGATIYRDPREFFAFTYPTHAIRELARDVVRRLAGENDLATHQLELTYGGGKTHTLITLYHLVREPSALPTDLPSYQEFRQHIGIEPPAARVAVLPFDKLDVERGMEVIAPGGERRTLRRPWSVLAWQLCGAEGLELLHGQGQAAERDTAPAQPLLEALLARPAADGMATLVLIDEVLMYAREMVAQDPAWQGRLQDFFQYLTQAAARVPRCAVVASLLATDPEKDDAVGRRVALALYDIFGRGGQEGVQPVAKEDVAEIMRRRFFKPHTVANQEAFRPAVIAALQGIAALDEETQRGGRPLEDAYLASYPFHPAVTEVLYTKWTNVRGFQRTRAVLRAFALALREAAEWDDSPLIGVNVFLSPPGESALSEGLRPFATVASRAELEGQPQTWPSIIEGELDKARAIEADHSALQHREVEQAVIATFLHSQPIGQRASTRDLMVLVGSTRPDRIELEKALRTWADRSWFLDEEYAAVTGLPKDWRLGARPNLKQMHADALTRIGDGSAEELLRATVQGDRTLKNVSGDVRVHVLPSSPADVADDGKFHFATLGPRAASRPGVPSPEAVRYLDETSGADRPRTRTRNAVVLAVPSPEGVDLARRCAKALLAWQEVERQLKGQDLDPARRAALRKYVEQSDAELTQAVRQAWTVVVTVGENNQAVAFQLSPGDGPLFERIVEDRRSRLQSEALAAGALLPGGPFGIWPESDPGRWVKDLVGAFAENPRLPKMLDTQAVLETVVADCRDDGLIVLRLKRPDGSLGTWWRETVPDAVLTEPGLEAVLPEHAELSSLAPRLLEPGGLPDLWDGEEITVGQVVEFFGGGRPGVPRAPREVIEGAVAEAVKKGSLWLISGTASLWNEEPPENNLISLDARLRRRPEPIGGAALLPDNLPQAWTGTGEEATATALSIYRALSEQAGLPLPWTLVKQTLSGALGHLLERRAGPWPCDLQQAGETAFGLLGGRRPTPTRELVAQAALAPAQLQDLAEQLGEIGGVQAAAGVELRFHLTIELVAADHLTDEQLAALNTALAKVSDSLRFRRE